MKPGALQAINPFRLLAILSECRITYVLGSKEGKILLHCKIAFFRMMFALSCNDAALRAMILPYEEPFSAVTIFAYPIHHV